MRRPQWIPSRDDAPGLALAACIALVSTGLVRLLPRSAYFSDIVLGIAVGALVINTPLRRLVGAAGPGAERERDRYGAGVRFLSKWVLRLAIVLMGMKVQTRQLGLTDVAMVSSSLAVGLPGAFLLVHVGSALAGVRRPLADLIAGGSMICGASAVNALAPVVNARREEQGIAVGVVFFFSVVALLAFRPLALVLGLDAHHGGLWAGLAVNDLSSAIAVGGQMGSGGDVIAAAAKSTRILLLAPTLVAVSLLRRREQTPVSLRRSAIESLPGFVVGYVALALVRLGGDRLFGGAPGWMAVVDGFRMAADFLLTMVSAGIGLHLMVRTLLASGATALVAGACGALWMSGTALAMVWAGSRGMISTVLLVALVVMTASFVAYRRVTARESEARRLRARFGRGEPMSLAEGMRLLDALEEDGSLGASDDAVLRRVLSVVHPSVGELITVRESPLPHGEGCKWITFWEGRSGWAMVALSREPGSATPIHAHPHRLIGKTVEGALEELRFEPAAGTVRLVARAVLAHQELVEADGPRTVHVVRALGQRPAIDIQLRGAELGAPGRRFRTAAPLDFDRLQVGDELPCVEEIDDRPGHGGEGAACGRVASA